MADPQDEGFARRWSRLKQQARTEASPEAAPAPDLPQAGDTTAPVQESSATQSGTDQREEKPFDPADLPPIDSLTAESDYTLFMRKEVPEALRQQALRRLWATDPVLSAPDLYEMYNLDFNAVPTFPEGVKSLYRVGQGMFDELETAAEEAAAKKKVQEASSTPLPQDAAAESRPVDADEPASDVASQHADLKRNDDSGQSNS